MNQSSANVSTQLATTHNTQCRTTGGPITGIAVSLAVVAVGAVLTFALEREAEGINLDAVGIIIMIIGIIGLVASTLFWSNWGPYNRTRRGTAMRQREIH